MTIISMFKKNVFIIFLLITITFNACGTLTKDIHVKMNKPVRVNKHIEKLAIITPNNHLQLNVDLASAIAEKAKAKNIQIVDVNKADYILTVSIPVENGLVDEDGNIVALSALTTGVGGFAVAYGVTRNTGTAVGAGLASAAGGALLGYALKDSSTSMQVDFIFTDPDKKKEFQQTRLFSTVRQMHMDEAEGKKALVAKISTDIVNVLKQKKDEL